jgi:ABC-2 type transport system permease protein
MKKFIGFVIKEFNHIFRDFQTMLILFGIPVAQLLIFGYVVTNELKDIKIAILDQSKDDVTLEISNKIIASGYFILDQNLKSDKDIDKIFRQGNVRLIVIFEPDFAKKLEREHAAKVQLIADASDANTANLIVNYTSGIIYNYINSINGTNELPLKIIPEVRMVYNEGMKGVYMFVPGTMAMILMLISALMTSVSIVREKEMGTMEVLLVSPLKPGQIILGKVIPYVALAFIDAVVIIALGYWVFGMPVRGSLLLLIAESFLYISMALSLGLFISTVTNNQLAAMFISFFALMLPTLLLSGFIFPIENMPLILQWLSALIPPRWFIVIIKNIMLKGVGFEYVWKETLIIALTMIGFIALSIKKFKIRLE